MFKNCVKINQLDYRQTFKHKLQYEKMTATTPNMFIAGFSNRPLGPTYKKRLDSETKSECNANSSEIGAEALEARESIFDAVNYGGEQFSHKRFGIENRNEKTSLYPYNKF